MKIIRGYKTELDLNDKQRTACMQHAGAARFAYNWGLERKKAAYAAGQPAPSAIALHRELNTRKKSEFPWMYQVSKCAMQEALRDLDSAFAHFFRRCRLKKAGQYKGKLGFPRWKARKRTIGSFTLTGTIKVGAAHIQLPRLGKLRLHEQGYIPTTGARVLSATVSERAGRWFVAVHMEEEVPDPATGDGPVIGVDLGVKMLTTTSAGEPVANPRALGHALQKLRRLSRQLARRKKGGRNREKTRRKLARAHYRITNIRRDTSHKATHELTVKTKPAVIVLEDLNVAGMLKNKRLARAIADAAMGELRRQIQYKAAWQGIRVVIADRFYPSSKTCSGCGLVKAELPLEERVFKCAGCGLEIDRDLNAARNLAAWAGGEPSRVAPTTASSAGSDACGEAVGPSLGGELQRSRNHTPNMARP